MVPNTSTHKTVPLFASILIKAWRTTNISKDQTMIALQLKGKMITAFKPSKPDRPRTHCLKQDERMKKRILFVNDENSKRNICSYCISKSYCHLGFKNRGRSTTGCTRPQNNMFEKIKHQHSAHCNNRILHIACHLQHERHTSDVCHLKP